MKVSRRFRIAITSLLFSAPVFCMADPVIIGTYPVPVVETKDYVTDWLHEAGFQVSQEYSNAGKVVLECVKDQKTFHIEIKPQSPLASYVEVSGISTTGGKNGSSINGLKAALDGYVLNINSQKPVPFQRTPSELRSFEKVVFCLSASVSGARVTFTGFAIDRKGFIITTAHDLDKVRRISVQLDNGDILAGEVVKRDKQRDLSLIKVKKTFSKIVSVKDGRRELDPGSKVFSLVCPSSGGGIAHAGIVDKSTALVNGQPLWRVTMEVKPGSSGSPVFDAEGRLAGIVKGRFRGTETLGFLIPLDTIRDFLVRGEK
jgi:serine protease Do